VVQSISTGGKVNPAGLYPEIKKTPLTETLHSEKGIALIIVLWVLAFLMFIVVEFAFSMRVETETVRNLKDETAARYLALAGINMGLAELAADYDIILLNEDKKLVFGKQEANGLSTLDVKREFAMGDGRVRYIIEDEEAKVNLNTASRKQIKELLRLTGLEVTTRDVVADSILDWRDKNHSFHFNGAEDDYYGSLPNPYGAMDGPFENVEELLLVKGVTPEMFYGTGKVPPELIAFQDSLSSRYERQYTGLAPYVTVKGEGKVNLNTADPTVLDAMLGKGKSMEITLRRETEGYFNWPLYGGQINSRVFSIRAEGDVHGMRFNIKTIAERDLDNPEARIIYWNDGATALN